MKPGVYPGLPMADYLAIPAFSAGLATIALTECMRKAWWASWLNPNPPPADDTDGTDIGTTAHSMLLEGGAGAVELIDPMLYPSKTGSIPDGWKNNAIREARDNARAAGKIPILQSRWSTIEAMHRAAVDFVVSLRDQEAAVFNSFDKTHGEQELTLVWEEGDVLCKARCDAIDRARSVIVNYKTTKGNVEPEAWSRGQLLDYYVGGAFYTRGAYACFGSEPGHAYLVQQTSAPYMCSLVGLDPKWIDLGHQKVKAVTRGWAKCVASGVFPGYPSRVVYPEVPPWEELRWNERQINDQINYAEQA